MAIELDNNTKEVNGYYFYNKHQKNIILKGQFNSSQITLIESVDNKITGQFELNRQSSYDKDGFHVGQNKYWTGKWSDVDKSWIIKFIDIKMNK